MSVAAIITGSLLTEAEDRPDGDSKAEKTPIEIEI